jgi:DNA-binding transcriptional regulator YiaG
MTKEEIRKLRNKLGDNREEFGKRFGVSKHAVQAWEQGNRIPSEPVMLLLNMLNDKRKK